AILRGGESGQVVAPHQPDDSLIWQRINDNEMPPKKPLAENEKKLINDWILAGAPGLPKTSDKGASEHWAFRSLGKIQPPTVNRSDLLRNEIDRFIESSLETKKRTLFKEAPKERLIRRVSLLLTGLPPSPLELNRFLNDRSGNSYTKMVERYLASPRYGEKWGKLWLDAAGYADSNGYFNADTDRPMAFRYRDYVIRALNKDLGFDRFISEQLAGDELSGFWPGQAVPPEVADQLIATHFLRNGQDGSGESDGNPDELRVDRYSALESCQQIVATALLGLTLQCAKCHSHKFEPISHEDYYRFQAVFSPVFPAATESLWTKPQARFVQAPTPSEKRSWVHEIQSTETELKRLDADLQTWVRNNRPAGEFLFSDDFKEGSILAGNWSNVAPGDDKPGGNPPVNLDQETPPAARAKNGRLEIIAGKTLDSWLTTKQKFDWTPDRLGDSIQVTFHLIDNRLSPAGKPAERVGYFIATHDFDDSGPVTGGNILIDGHPTSSTSVWADYPGKDAVSKGSMGKTGYSGGRNYGVRVTNKGKGEFLLEHLIDGFAEDGSITLPASDLPDGGFGFEYHADRSFIIDDVVVERFHASSGQAVNNGSLAANQEYIKRKTALEIIRKKRDALKNNPPFKIAWASDVTPNPPETHLLLRGDYARPGDAMAPAPLSALSNSSKSFAKTRENSPTTGRRLQFAEWLTGSDSRAAALMARVQVNRIWQAYFGRGIVATPDNFGQSGAAPTHPELLDWLAGEFIRSGWSLKHIHRLILASATFRQSSDESGDDVTDESLLSGFPSTRLDAETIRDAMLAVAGDLDKTMGGPYVPISTRADGAIVIAENQQGGHRRSIYLQQRRTQVVSMLQVFDAPTIVFNSLRRPRTAMPLQALTLMNSDFVRARATSFARRIENAAKDDSEKICLAFELAFSRPPTKDEHQAATVFLESQKRLYGENLKPGPKTWTDFCQTLLMSNEFLYLD
ncbi:MAG: PSD1 and planctomycete cytochrome C domain-containing protein, partial [Isosphaeraceae bacterium]